LSSQALHQSAKGFFIAAVPSPLALLYSIDQASPGQDGHVMGDGGLGELHALFNVSGAEARVLSERRWARGGRATVFEGSEDATSRRVGNRMQRVVE
jgi:hypothetical protein